jgi:sugar diacid utilization regulator
VVQPQLASVTTLRVLEPREVALNVLLAAAPTHPLVADTPYCAAVSVSPPTGRLAREVWSVQVEHEGLVWLLAEADDTATLNRLLPPDATAGIGLPRRGSHGAARSLVDARQAFALSRSRGVPVAFGDDWVAATIAAAGDALDELCAVAVGVATRSPHLADAVRAFAQQGLSVVGAARSLHVHANTVIYRLERWQRLTGWDARTFDGLSQSMAALTHAQVQA